MLISVDKQTDNKIKKAIRRVEADLIGGNYKKLVAENKSRVTAGEIEEGLKEYKEDCKMSRDAKITPAPDYVFDNLEIMKISVLTPATYHVDYTLWIDGKLSDLTLQMDIAPTLDDANVFIEDLHVM